MLKSIVLVCAVLIAAAGVQAQSPPPPVNTQFISVNFVRNLIDATTAEITLFVGTSVEVTGLTINFGVNSLEFDLIEITNVEYLQGQPELFSFDDADPLNSCPLVDSDGTVTREGTGQIRCGDQRLSIDPATNMPLNYVVSPFPPFPFLDVFNLVTFTITESCVTEAECVIDAATTPYLRFTLSIPQGTPLGAIVIWGPGDDDDPTFSTPSLVDTVVDVVEDPPLATPTPTPVPTPATPAPAPAPTPAVMKSDPHLLGLRGQTFDFHGTSGKIYNIIAESSPSTALDKLFVNALMGTAYTAAISDGVTGSTPTVGKGTWMKSLGIVTGGSNSVEILHIPTPSISACRDANAKRIVDACIKFGGLKINGAEVTSVGEVTLNLRDVEGGAPRSSAMASVEVMNSLTFTRYTVIVPTMKCTVDIVNPPKTWNIAPEDAPEYNHLNFKIDRLSVINAMGVLGETSQIRKDADGNDITSSNGPNGEGLLLFGPEQYEVPSLVSEIVYPQV